MANDKAKILVLVEGEKTDVKLMEHLLTIYGIDKNHQIVSYKTNIYDLYDKMFADSAPETVDLLGVLKERETNEAKKSIFDMHYSDILLIFDLDPQDPRFAPEKIISMANYFVESSDMGKLYINYPMVEAFYHMKNIPDSDYNSYVATIDELKRHLYKGRVVEENRNRRFGKFAVNKQECSTVIQQNLNKAWMITGTQANNTEQLYPYSEEILEKQLKKIREEASLFVLCTCAFYIADYNPKFIETE